MVEFFSDEMRRNPYPVYEQMRATSPVLHVPQFNLWMIFDYDGVKQAVNDPAAFSSATAPCGAKPFDWLIFSDPPRHTKWRALIMRAFTPRMIAGMEPRIRALSCQLLEPLVARGEMDLVTDYSARLPIMVIAQMLGLPLDDIAQFKRWADAILNLAHGITGGAPAARAAGDFSTATVEMRRYLAPLLDARREEPHDDLLTRLVEAEVDGERLTENELLGFFQLLLLAGSETTTNLINLAMLCLMEYADERERVRAAPQLIPSAIEEVLRYRSPVQAVFRHTTRDVLLHGQVIPRGSLVLPMIGSANRDPRAFAEPDRFDVGRDPNPHIAFGHGPHFCLGATLSRLEASITLQQLLSQLDDVQLVSDEPWQPREALHVHGPTSLPIRFRTRQAAAAIA